VADPFVLVDQFAAQGKLKPALVAKVKAKGGYLLGAVGRAEKATGLRYPPYYVEPTLPLAVTSLEYGSVGAFFARVIPTAFEGRLSIIVQFTAPLLLFGTKATVEAVTAHEFTHYVDLVRRLSRTDIVSEERVSTLFEAKVSKGWIAKGLPTRRVSTEENNVRLDMGMVARTTFDPRLLEKIREMEAPSTARK